VQRHHYFAKALCIGDDGHEDISKILPLHQTLRDSLSARLDDPVTVTVAFAFLKMHAGTKLEDIVLERLRLYAWPTVSSDFSSG
jgi:hypothetical protein